MFIFTYIIFARDIGVDIFNMRFTMHKLVKVNHIKGEHTYMFGWCISSTCNIW